MNINNPTTFGSPSLVYSTSNSSGTGGALRADDTIAIFSATVPTDISTSAVSASTGDNAFGAREDHVHGSTAVIAISSVAEMEAATSTTTVVSPGRTQNHPGVAKAYCNIQANGTLDTSNKYNVASVTDTGPTDRTVVWDTDFATSLTYSVLSTMVDIGSAQVNVFTYRASKAVGSSRITSASGVVAPIDTEHSVVAFGDQ